ncbi:hypothetical protein DBR32_03240 [Taibaiella sp. KBW10]|uniref:hypothetical protein n=1 Tax=Taibaiella sp. KBW10 TaxID=2153357 RepID=UPI000F598A58|nr:hypothetical protein [Taibaiella sp. KBW10]RQO32621.1 hypothetical protein DBR32_03240 [Taibaiella sp. KBW10]
MKDIFEERLKAKLEALESDPEVANMLSRDAVWDRISTTQKPLQKKQWFPQIFKLAAALIICVGMALLIKFQQPEIAVQPPLVQAAKPADAKTDTPTPVADVAKESNTEYPAKQEPVSVTHQDASRVGDTQRLPDRKDIAVEKTDPLKVPSMPESSQIVKENALAAQPAVVYLSDLEKESPAVLTVAPRKSMASRKVIRYMKSNLEEYTCVPPIVFINQILNK